MGVTVNGVVHFNSLVGFIDETVPAVLDRIIAVNDYIGQRSIDAFGNVE